jgi:ADP-ribosyl-[dinitrogen reductase] hydrolase
VAARSPAPRIARALPHQGLWAFHGAGAFEEALLRAVNLGDDADTTGAICGQLAGAFWGESNIPEPLRSGLARMDMIGEALAGIL